MRCRALGPQWKFFTSNLKKFGLGKVVLGIFICQLVVVFASYQRYLNSFVDQIVAEIKTQKNDALINGDSLAIAKEINSISGHEYMRCAKIISQGQELYNYARNLPCDLPFFSVSRSVSSASQEVFVQLYFELPNMMQLNFLLFMLLEVFMIISVGYLIKKIKEVEFREVSKFNFIAAKAAHDIRSPLGALSAISLSLPDSYGAQRDLIKNVVDRISVISKELYQMSKSETRNSEQARADIHLRKQSEPIDLILQIRNAISEIEAVERSDIQLSLQTNRESLILKIDPYGFRRVLSNLFNNAIEAKGSSILRVGVQVIVGDTKAVVSIHDNGVGMPPEVLKKVGKLRISYGKSTNSNSGSGLGLLSAFEYMQSQNGTIAINSKLGVGTIISLEFPI